MPEKTKVISKNSPLQQWNLSLTDPTLQKVAIATVTDSKKKKMTAFSVTSNIQKPVVIFSFAVPAKKGMRFSASAQFKAEAIKSGLVEIRLKQIFSDGTEKILLSREPKNLAKSAKWIPSSVTIPKKDPLLRNGKIIFEIRCSIKGMLMIRKCSLKRK